MRLTMTHLRLSMSATLVASLMAGCSTLSVPGGFDLVNGPPNTETPRQPTVARPEPDARGVISYPNYQVAVANSGDTAQSIAQRLGVDAAALARLNGLPEDATLRRGELVVLPSRVAESGTALSPGGEVDVAVIAGNALDRADGGSSNAITPAPSSASAAQRVEPIRHTVVRGETAYSIARSFNVSVTALSDWNGLDSSLTVREGQILLIPVTVTTTTEIVEEEDIADPGTGSQTPEPPSAAQPQPEQDLAPAAAGGVAATTIPDSSGTTGAQTSASDTSALLQPVAGRIIRGYSPGQNEGLDFGASSGAAVRAADDGTVAAITRDTDQVPILVLRHSNNLLTVYANVDNIAVEKGTRVSRGQRIASVRDSDPSFLHFEVRKGFDSVDPLPYLSN